MNDFAGAGRHNRLAPLKHPRICYGAAYAALFVVAIASLMPAPDVGGSDKLHHFIAYAILSLGFVLLVRTPLSLLRTSAGLIGYGVMLELLQSLTGYRQMEVLDMLANAAGVVAALPLWWTPLPLWFRRVEAAFG